VALALSHFGTNLTETAVEKIWRAERPEEVSDLRWLRRATADEIAQLRSRKAEWEAEWDAHCRDAHLPHANASIVEVERTFREIKGKHSLRFLQRQVALVEPMLSLARQKLKA
jgi:hypothetical protein